MTLDPDLRPSGVITSMVNRKRLTIESAAHAAEQVPLQATTSKLKRTRATKRVDDTLDELWSAPLSCRLLTSVDVFITRIEEAPLCARELFLDVMSAPRLAHRRHQITVTQALIVEFTYFFDLENKCLKSFTIIARASE
jgi:hypothetical protein